MKQAHLNRFLSSTIVAFLLTAHVASAKSVELQAEVTMVIMPLQQPTI